MRAPTELKAPNQVDPKTLHRIFFFDHFCLITAGIIALMNLLPGMITPLAAALPRSWPDMRIPGAATILCAVLSLYFSEATQPRPAKVLAMILGTLTSAIAVIALFPVIGGSRLPLGWILDRNQVVFPPTPMEVSFAALFLVGIAILLGSFRGRRAARITDVLALILAFAVFALVLESLFRLAGLSSSSASGLKSISTLACIALLTIVVILRRTEGGFLSLLWGYGTGSRMARMLAPILFLLPMLREIARAHLLRSRWIPSTYAAAILTSAGTGLALVLLFVLARIINRMQQRIQNDVLRDELTSLYSVRGFYLLAEQSFRHSRRTREPFGAIFIDMDNLKTINDKLGHSMGSVSLVETAKLLTANFRDTDIIGRVGGDEFLVAGHFNNRQILAAVERLREATARKNDVVGQQFSISLSVGYAVAEDYAHETLHSLVAKADEAMYKEKRGKKEARAAAAAQPDNHSSGAPQNKAVAFGQIVL
ncbi:MAG TPA: GGDEF domain-containing protein [Terracidiphilus sp.]|nr:GGDEF domain-containing protein [Terracidiphilus sp.]